MNDPMYTTEEQLKQVLSLKPNGYPIPYYPDQEHKEPIDVLLWHRFPYMDLIYGVPAEDHPFKEDVKGFFEMRMRDKKTNTIVGGKRYYLDFATLVSMFRGVSYIMGHHNLFTGNQIEKIERDDDVLRPQDTE